MAIVVEQTVIDIENRNASMVDIAYGSDVTAGSLLIYYLHGWDSGGFDVTGITDTQGNTWQQAVRSDGGTPFSSELWYAMNADAGATTLTITVTGGGGKFFGMGIQEVSGIATTNALDTTGEENDTTGAPQVTADAESSVADTFLAAVHNHDQAGTDAFTHTSGWTEVYDSSNGAQDQPGHAEYRIETVAATETADWSRGANTGAYYACIAVFKIAGAGVALEPDTIRSFAIPRAANY